MNRSVAAALALLAVTGGSVGHAHPSPATADPPASGIRGLVTIGGCSGPEQPADDGPSCGRGARFAADVRVLRQRDGVEVGRFRSRASDGRFRIRLRRGRYVLDPLETTDGEPNGGLYKGTIRVKVQRGEFTRIWIKYDGGARG